jgi:hypothetical protein
MHRRGWPPRLHWRWKPAPHSRRWCVAAVHSARDLDAIRTWQQARQLQRDGSAVAAEQPGGPLPLAKPKA